MIRILSTQEELQQAYEETKDSIDLLAAHHALDNKLTNRFPEADYTIFLHENPSVDKLYIVYRITKWTVPWIIFSCSLDAKFEKASLYEAFPEVSKRYPNIFHVRTLHKGPEFIIEQYKEWMTLANPEYAKELKYYPTYLYYMTDKQKQKVMDYEIKLPEGYRFAEKVNFDRDPDVMNSTWLHCRKGDEHLTRAKLRNNPWSIVYDSNDQPVAYEMVDMCDLPNHLYTDPAHREKGLGTAVERVISKKCIKAGIMPCKTVETWNDPVLASSNRSPYWTRWDHAGKPVEYVYAALGCEERLKKENKNGYKIENGC